MDNPYVPGMREQHKSTCWRLLNESTRACIRERGHDEGVHEDDPEKACSNSSPHDEHDWTQRYVCHGVGGAES